MNELHYSPEAQNDLSEIMKYITLELASPTSALNTVDSIVKKLRRLEQFAEAGARLSSIIVAETDYRYLVCGNYLAFYRIEGNNIYVDRVIYCRRDYIGILFDGLPRDRVDTE